MIYDCDPAGTISALKAANEDLLFQLRATKSELEIADGEINRLNGVIAKFCATTEEANRELHGLSMPPDGTEAAEPDDPKSVANVLLGWAKAYRDAPEHRFPSDPDAEFFPQDLEYAAGLLSAAPPVRREREQIAQANLVRDSIQRVYDEMCVQFSGIHSDDRTDSWLLNLHYALKLLSLPSAPVSGRDAVIEECAKIAEGFIGVAGVVAAIRALSNHKEPKP